MVLRIDGIDVWRGVWRCTHAKLAPLTPHPLPGIATTGLRRDNWRDVVGYVFISFNNFVNYFTWFVCFFVITEYRINNNYEWRETPYSVLLILWIQFFQITVICFVSWCSIFLQQNCRMAIHILLLFVIFCFISFPRDEEKRKIWLWKCNLNRLIHIQFL